MRTALIVLFSLAPAFAGKPVPADPHPLAGTYARSTGTCFITCFQTDIVWTIDADGSLSGLEVSSGKDPWMGRGKFTTRKTYEGVVDADGRLRGTVTTKVKSTRTTSGYNAWLELDADGNLVVLADVGNSLLLFRTD